MDEPTGLYLLSSLFTKSSIEVEYLNCMDRFHNSIPDSQNMTYNTGKYHSKEVEKPIPYKDIPRKYKRYGITEEAFLNEIKSLNDLFAIFITCMMTYWYTGLYCNNKTYQRNIS